MVDNVPGEASGGHRKLGGGKRAAPLPIPPQIHFLQTFLEAESGSLRPLGGADPDARASPVSGGDKQPRVHDGSPAGFMGPERGLAPAGEGGVSRGLQLGSEREGHRGRDRGAGAQRRGARAVDVTAGPTNRQNSSTLSPGAIGLSLKTSAHRGGCGGCCGSAAGGAACSGLP